MPPAFTDDDVEVEAAAPPWLPLVLGAGAVEPVLVLACPLEPSEEAVVAAPAGAPEVLAAVLVCPDELGDVVVAVVDPAEPVPVVAAVPVLDPAWVAVVVEPGAAEDVAEVDVDPFVAVVVLDVAEGAGDACVVVVVVVLPATAVPELVDAVETVDVGAGLVLADVFDELCVLEVPPLTVG